MTVSARYDSGSCQECDRPIRKGEDIDRDDEGVWVHSGCRRLDETEPERYRPRPICDSCWLEKPCGCEPS